MNQQVIDFLTRNWVWIALIVLGIFIIVAVRNKMVKEKIESLFGYPPSP